MLAALLLALLVAGCTIETQGLARAGEDGGPPADAGVRPAERIIRDDAFEDFAAGDLGRSAANLYVRADGAIAPVVRGDADGDGHADVVVPWHATPGVWDVPSRIYLGRDGTFDPARFVELPTRGAIHPLLADLNGDDHTDAVFANHYSAAVGYAPPSVVYWGAADGFLATRRTELATVAAFTVETADLNRDGWLDLVFTSYTSASAATPGVYVYWGSPEGFATERRLELPATEIIDVCPADFDEDGWVDLFLVRRYSHAIRSLAAPSQLVRFSADGPLPPVLFPTVGASGCAVADVDADGDLDVLVTQYSDDLSRPLPSLVFRGDGPMPRADDPMELDVSFTGRPTLADFDRDGWIDALTPQSWSGASRLTNTPISFGSREGFEDPVPLLASASPLDADVRDFDGNGFPDVLLASYTGDDGAAYRAQPLFMFGSDGPASAPVVSLPGSYTSGSPARDWGHTWDRSDREWFVSRPLDVGPMAVPLRIEWGARVPGGARVRLQLRSARSVEALAEAPWSGPTGDGDWFTGSPSAIHASHAGDRYLQYRVELLFTAAGGPTLEHVTIRYR